MRNCRKAILRCLYVLKSTYILVGGLIIFLKHNKYQTLLDNQLTVYNRTSFQNAKIFVQLPSNDLQSHCHSVLDIEKLEHLVRTACFICLWLYGLITIGYQILTAPFLVNKGVFLSNISDNQLIKPVAISQGDVIAQKPVGR